MSDPVYRAHSGYFSRAFGNMDLLIEAMRTDIPVAYDTLIGTGLSGTLVVPSMARALDVRWAIVRKDEEQSHASTRIEGEIGTRWLFVDDFISSGRTYRRVQAAVAATVGNTAMVGAWLYEQGSYGRFDPPALMPVTTLASRPGGCDCDLCRRP